MLAVIRIILMTLIIIVVSICSCLFCLLRPFHRDNVHHTAKYMGKVAKVLGLDVEVRIPEVSKDIGPVVYICNHQNSYDIFTVSNAVQPGTVSVGKKSLKWIPFFGQMYWLTGNILIDRKNKNKAMNTIALTAKKIREKKLSVWLFPEGTRSYGRGLLPFKTGAFRTAAQAEVPIVPICASSTHKTIDLNRWNNGKMIIEFLAPVALSSADKDKIRQITNQTHAEMQAKIAQLNQEVGHKLPSEDDNKSSKKQASEIK
ncbi:1-acyl-sn-glycerol-3-phosphate acyltransferase [Colwellia chukchiensis]|uniref:1-acyl-sn-glycerol-3-phosphate acyltransferase n=1 Tax=Colwellia chukchiensis TaxID=641665 RepID=A0A1H7HZT7_9GAMM|nr:1-acylglycerol-3-phosphate O-acyltransferase [Colwellia chukchiensis]SEK55739.1 1-acyl-sn-glycerol-3-phosphate acyltransferase [Colwellia chukchiensis]